MSKAERRVYTDFARGQRKNQVAFDGASQECIDSALDSLFESYHEFELDPARAPMPKPSVLCKHLLELCAMSERLISRLSYELDPQNRVHVSNRLVLGVHTRARLRQAADLLLKLIILNYDRSEDLAQSIASASSILSGHKRTDDLDETPVLFQSYETDQRLLGETPTLLALQTRWYLLAIVEELYAVNEGDPSGQSYGTEHARALAQRVLTQLSADDTDEKLVRARLCATRRPWSTWTQSDVRAILACLASRKTSIGDASIFPLLRIALTWIEQRLSLFMVFGMTDAVFDLGDNPFIKGTAAVNRFGYAGASGAGRLYTMSREYSAHCAHTLTELYIPCFIHDAFPSMALDADPPLPLEDIDIDDDAGNQEGDAHAFVEALFKDVGADEDDDFGAAWRDETFKSVHNVETPRRLSEELVCGCAQWLESETINMFDRTSFRGRVLPTVSFMELRPGEKHAFARMHNGGVLPSKANSVHQKLRTVPQVTDLLETIKKKQNWQLLSRARPVIRAATLMHTFDVMVSGCRNSSIFEWKRHVLLFEQDFFVEYAQLHESLTPAIVHHAGCYSVAFRCSFYHCRDLVEAIALSTLFIVHTLKCVFPVGLRRFDVDFMRDWLLLWHRMGRIYLEKNPFSQTSYVPSFEPFVMADEQQRAWFPEHWRHMESVDTENALMEGMCLGFQPVELIASMQAERAGIN